jgi:two-component system, OmpR family, response regulator RegX3
LRADSGSRPEACSDRPSDPGQVFTRAELIAGVWGAGYVGGDRTVDVHIRWIRAKLEENPSRPVHVITVRGTGYRLDPPSP